MIKTLTKHGNSLALAIEKPILELLGADADRYGAGLHVHDPGGFLAPHVDYASVYYKSAGSWAGDVL